MSTLQPESLRKHRQTLLPGAKKNKKDYGMLQVPGNEQLPAVGLKDREKVGNLVKRRFSSRNMMNDVYDSGASMPSLPENAADMINQANAGRPPRSPTSDDRRGGGPSQQPLPKQQLQPKQPQQQHPPQQRPRPEQQSSQQSLNGQKAQRPPQDYQQRPRQERRPSTKPREEPARETLEEPNFDAQYYISQNLSSATNVEISGFADKLSSMQESLVGEKKEAMYKNYKTFLHVGKEITYLGSEIDTLRKLLNDLHSATSAMKEDADSVLTAHDSQHGRNLSSQSQTSLHSDSGGRSAPRGHHNNRSSMIFLEEDYGKQLASLYRHVEGARQYLPNSQGRRVVKESGGWYQLNAATWKPFQPVSLFLLNDHLLVATKKRVRHGESLGPNQAAPNKLVAEQCWPLQEIEVSELVPKNSRDPGAMNALCIKTGAVSFVYRADKPSAHADFYPKLKQVKHMLKGNESEGQKNKEHQARLQDSMDYYAKQTPTLKSHRSLLENYSSARSAHSRESSMDMSNNPRSKNLRELDEMINDLDVKIAYRQFSDAVNIIESNITSLEKSEAKSSHDDAYAEKMLAMSAQAAAAAANNNSKDSTALSAQVLRMKLEQRSQQLTDILVHEISQGYLSRLQVENNVLLLIKLGAADTAKAALLTSRRNIIDRRIKQVEFQGDTVGYMTQVAIIYFRLIRSTVEIFNKCFTANENTSAIVEWAKVQVEQYILLFARQLFDVDRSSDVYRSCAAATKRESEQLKQVGLDLTFVLNEITN